MVLVGAEGTLYAGEKYILRFNFPEDYPIEAPEVCIATCRRQCPDPDLPVTGGV